MHCFADTHLLPADTHFVDAPSFLPADTCFTEARQNLRLAVLHLQYAMPFKADLAQWV